MEFAQVARRFDPAVRAEDVFQASRNIWTMNGLQLLLGLPVQLTPAMFAYSVLYPYSDNYLDDPRVPEETKIAFNERFRRRLTGEGIAPANTQEQTIYDLVSIIERQFERSRYPQVFESLLAIHRAQNKSLRLLRREASPYEIDVLGICLEKGGTSVLADGFLVAGNLTQTQAKFMFGLGAFMQFGDDLQDVQQDSRDGLATAFSQTARHWPLDALTNRTLNFGMRVMEGLDSFDAPGSEPLKELMKRSVALAFIYSAGAGRRFYTGRYLRELEAHAPLRFSFVNKRLRRLASQRASLMQIVEAFAAPDDLRFSSN